MSEILLRWIREDIGMPQVTVDLDGECANGMLIGKILNHYGIFPELDKLVNKSTPEAKVSNYQRLLPALKALNIRFNSQIANDLMTEEKGIGLKILQQLKSHLDTGKRTKDSTGVSSRLLLPIRVSHVPKHKNLEDQTFEVMKQLKSSNPKEYRLQHFLHPFEQEAVKQQKTAEHGEELSQTSKYNLLSDLRHTHLGKLKDNREYLRSWEEQGRQNHSKNQTDKTERERRDLRLELAVREKARRRASAENLTAADEALGGIDDFEEALRRLQARGGIRPGRRAHACDGARAV